MPIESPQKRQSLCQYDEEITPIPYQKPERLVRVQPVANPAPTAGVSGDDISPELRKEMDDFLEEFSRPEPSSSSKSSRVRGDPRHYVDPDAGPSLADPMDVAPLEDVADVAPPQGAASSAPEHSRVSDKHPLDDKLLKDLADGDPTKERELKRAASAPEHLRSHFPKNP